MASDDGDITLGPGKLLGLFFMLVAICGVFFAIGYSLGKTSAREQAMNDKAAVNASLASPAVTESSVGKPSAVVSMKNKLQTSVPEDQPDPKSEPNMTFYNAVKRSDGATQPVAAGTTGGTSPKTAADKAADPRATTNIAAAGTNSTNHGAETKSATGSESKIATSAEIKPVAASTAAGSYVVQIAAVSREEDAAALAGALRKKSYNVFVVNNPAVHDKLYHVQVGPFSSAQDAEAMKAKLTGEGYNPIVKRS